MTHVLSRAVLYAALLSNLAGCLVNADEVSGEMTVRLYFEGHSSVPTTMQWTLHEVTDTEEVEISSGDNSELTEADGLPALHFTSLEPAVYGIQVEAEESGYQGRGACLLPLDRFEEVHDCTIRSYASSDADQEVDPDAQ